MAHRFAVNPKSILILEFISLLVVQAPPGSKNFKGLDQCALGAGGRKHWPHGRDLLAMSLQNVVSQWLMGEVADDNYLER